MPKLSPALAFAIFALANTDGTRLVDYKVRGPAFEIRRSRVFCAIENIFPVLLIALDKCKAPLSTAILMLC